MSEASVSKEKLVTLPSGEVVDVWSGYSFSFDRWPDIRYYRELKEQTADEAEIHRWLEYGLINWVLEGLSKNLE